MITTRFAFRGAGAAAVAVGMMATGLAATTLAGGSAAAAPAKGLPAKYAKFANCPINNKKVNFCLAASSSSAFSINTTTLDSNGPVVLTLGLIGHKNGSYTAVLPDNGTLALQAKPINAGSLVPGLGLPALSVTATPQLAGTPTFSLDNLANRSGAALKLPLDVLLGNRLGLLGSTCTIGTSKAPIKLTLTDGRTKPPAPNKPIRGQLKSLTADGNGVVTAGVKLVDNSFAVPGASGCGVLDGLVNIDQLVDSQKGLPSAAGTNTAILVSTSGLAPASVIRKYLK